MDGKEILQASGHSQTNKRKRENRRAKQPCAAVSVFIIFCALESDRFIRMPHKHSFFSVEAIQDIPQLLSIFAMVAFATSADEHSRKHAWIFSRYAVLHVHRSLSSVLE